MNECIYKSPELKEVLLRGELLLLNGSPMYPDVIGEEFESEDEFKM